MTDKIQIRTANHEDALQIAKLISLSGGGMFRFLFGKKELDVLKQMIQTFQSGFYHEHITVCEVNGQIAGMLLGFHDEIYESEKDVSNTLFMNSIGLRMVYAAPAIYALPSYFGHPEKDEYYINAIAVFDSFRGKGVGKNLMLWAEEKARLTDKPKLTLDVASNNLNAISLYRKQGYHISKSKENVLMKTMLGTGLHRMEKMLA